MYKQEVKNTVFLLPRLYINSLFVVPVQIAKRRFNSANIQCNLIIIGSLSIQGTLPPKIQEKV